MLSGRDPARLRQAIEQLQSPQRSLALPCDVGNPERLQSLWDGASSYFGRIDIWINYAGQNHPQGPLASLSPEQIGSVLTANLTGLILASRVAVRGMLEQGAGSLYNMEGLGSDGRRIAGTLVYSTTKHAVRYFTEGLIAELRGTPVRVGTLSPGMVLTDLLLQGQDQAGSASRRRIFSLLADRVETVTPFLVREILRDPGHGARIAWLTNRKIFWRLATAPLSRRKLPGDGG